MERALHQAHDGECRDHFGAKLIYQSMLILGYYCTFMLKDYELHVNKYEHCQENGKLQSLPSHELYAIISPWHLSIWVLYCINKINLVYRNGHKFIITAIKYFIKWLEDIPMK